MSGSRNCSTPGRGLGRRPRPIGHIPKPPTYLSQGGLARWQRDADEVHRYSRAVFRAEVIEKVIQQPDPTKVTVEQVRAVRQSVEDVMVAVVDQLKRLELIIESLQESDAAAALTTKGPRSEAG